MRVAVIGAGYVGLVSGACLAELGHSVVVTDKQAALIARLRRGDVAIYEPGLKELVAANAGTGRLGFADTIAAAIDGAAIVLIAVGTPLRGADGYADLSYVHAAADEIAATAGEGTVVVCKSTVPVGTNREVLRRMTAVRPETGIEVASNPEFLREGSAIEDFMKPRRIVVGVETTRAREALATLYAPLIDRGVPSIVAGFETAELIKYAANAFLATKLTFINEIADLCENVGADVREVTRAIGLDPRIGQSYLNPGPGFGGSCLPKDTRALARTAELAGSPLRLVEAVVAVNAERKNLMTSRIAAALGGTVRGKTVAVLGLAFKPDTNDLREAPALAIISALQAAGASIRAHDPACMTEAAKYLNDVRWCEGPYHAAEGADGMVIITEWDAYRALDLTRLAGLMRGSAVVDLRNIHEPAAVASAGLVYHPLGVARSLLETADGRDEDALAGRGFPANRAAAGRAAR